MCGNVKGKSILVRIRPLSVANIGNKIVPLV